MTPDEIASEFYPDHEMLKMDGYDDCMIGVVSGFKQEPVFAYDYDKVIAKLMADGMDRDEAEEFHDFNQAGAWMGEGTPMFIRTFNN